MVKEPERAAYKHQEPIQRAQSARHQDNPLYKHGMPELLARPRPPAAIVRNIGGKAWEPYFVRDANGSIRQHEFTFTGSCFTDGAMRGGPCKDAWRAGFAVILLSVDGRLLGGLYGTVPDWFPSSGRAELWGVIHALRHALPPLTIYVDSAEVVSGWLAGEVATTASCNSNADLWVISGD